MTDNAIVASFEKTINELHELICDQLVDADDGKDLLIEAAIGQLAALTTTIKSIITHDPR
jgi:hypothetical protein